MTLTRKSVIRKNPFLRVNLSGEKSFCDGNGHREKELSVSFAENV